MLSLLQHLTVRLSARALLPESAERAAHLPVPGSLDVLEERFFATRPHA